MLVSVTSCQSGESSAGVRLPRSEARDSIQANVKVLAQAEAKSEEAARKKRPADSEAAFSSKAHKTDDVQRKRAPIAFKPRGSAGAENGQREGSADLRRSGSQKEKGSVFERLHSGAGKAHFVSTSAQELLADHALHLGVCVQQCALLIPAYKLLLQHLIWVSFSQQSGYLIA